MLVGGGENMPKFQTMACGLGIQDSVIFTGPVSDTAPYMSAMDMVTDAVALRRNAADIGRGTGKRSAVRCL